MLAKGLAGLGLPLIVFVAYLGFTWNWRRLKRAQLRYGIVVSLIACAVVAVPWHHAMLIRHGGGFWNELFGDNHWRRMVIGRHGDRGSFEYFVRELGYGLLPWIAIVPAALGWSVMRARRAPAGTPEAEGEARKQDIVWLVTGVGLLSHMQRMEPRYLETVTPAIAAAVGIGAAAFADGIARRHGAAFAS